MSHLLFIFLIFYFIVKSIKSISWRISYFVVALTTTILSITDVSCASNTHEFLFPIISTETIGSSV
jgi:uncharacterized membrane protein